MGRPRRSDSAEAKDCDWSFTENTELMRSLERRAERAAIEYGVDADDVLQEVCLWLAVRPHLQDEDASLVLYRIGSRIQGIIKAHRGKPKVVSFDEDLHS